MTPPSPEPASSPHGRHPDVPHQRVRPAAAPSPGRRLVLDERADARYAAALLADGWAVAHGFANIYALTARGDAATVSRLNALKGRPPGQVGSTTAPRAHVLAALDLHALPPGLDAGLVAALVDELTALGPIGIRGPAAARVPDHLTAPAAGRRTTQVIVPGTACPGEHLLAAAWEAVDGEPLVITSANRSRHVTGGADAPAHWRAGPLRAELDGAERLVVLEHADEAVARARFPGHLPMSTSIVGVHATVWSGGRLCLPLERHGSLPAAALEQVLARHGLGLAVTAGARTRLAPRRYDDGGAAGGAPR